MEQSIFISYRREDSSGHAGRLYDDLSDRLGKGKVFMDVAGIQPGRDFRKVIEQQVGGCGVLLAVIGPQWLNSRDAQGRRRLDNPGDYVRLETATALKRDVVVVPVLVHGAQMMRPEDLPEDLQDLAFRNAFEIRDGRWRADVDLLASTLRAVLDGNSSVESTLTLRPRAPPAPAPAPEPAPVPPAPPAPARGHPLLWAGGGAVAVGLAGAAFFVLRPGPTPRTAESPTGPLQMAAVPAASTPLVATVAAAASQPVAVAAKPTPPAPSAPLASAASGLAPAAASTAAAAPAASSSTTTLATVAPASVPPPVATPPAEPVPGPASRPAPAYAVTAEAASVAPSSPAPATTLAAAASTPGRARTPVPARPRPVAPAPDRAATPRVSTLTVPGWSFRVGGCGGQHVQVKGVASFRIEASDDGVRVSQRTVVDDNGWRATLEGESRFDAPRPGAYRLHTRGTWTAPNGRQFDTEGSVDLFSPDGLKAQSARGVAIRTICP